MKGITKKFCIALLCSTMLAGCSASQLTTVLNDISEACSLVPIGTTFIVTLTSSIPAVSTITPIVQTVGTTAEADCEALETAVQGGINAINAAGATATVNVATTNGSPASVRRLAAKLMARYPAAAVVSTGRSVTFVVPPHGLF